MKNWLLLFVSLLCLNVSAQNGPVRLMNDAENGDIMALYELGEYYDGGISSRTNYGKSKQWFEKALAKGKELAEKGDAKGYYLMGRCYEKSCYGIQNNDNARLCYIQALNMLPELVNLGDGEAALMLGDCFYFGRGVEEDLSTALQLYHKAAEYGDSEAYGRIASICGRNLREGVDITELIYWLKRGAARFDVQTMYQLSSWATLGPEEKYDYELKNFMNWAAHLEETGNHEDAAEMFKYVLPELLSESETADVATLEKMVASGNPSAMDVLGERYLFGNGVQIDKTKANQLLLSAVEKHYVPAILHLANHYKYGLLTGDISSDRLFVMAARLGNRYAMYYVGEYIADANEIIEGEDAKTWWLKNAAFLSSSTAIRSLQYNNKYSNSNIASLLLSAAVSNERGDYQKAYDLLSKIYPDYGKAKQDAGSLQEKAEAGDVEAMYTLGKSYYKGENVEKDYTKAVLWFEKAAAGGHAEAMSELASALFNGNGVEKDAVKSLLLYKEAAKHGSVTAMYALSLRYKNGLGVTKDIKKAGLLLQAYNKAKSGDREGALTILFQALPELK